MGVLVRYRPRELSEAAETQHFPGADYYFIHDDNTLELRQTIEGSHKYRVIGHVHKDRWESAIVVDDDE
jgi:hypothetical protein